MAEGSASFQPERLRQAYETKLNPLDFIIFGKPNSNLNTMSQSLSQLYVHLTFGTKGRQDLIPEEISENYMLTLQVS